MTSWIAGPPQQLMRSSPFPWMNLIAINKILSSSSYRNNNLNNHGKNNYNATSHGNRKVTMANLGKTEDNKQVAEQR